MKRLLLKKRKKKSKMKKRTLKNQNLRSKKTKKLKPSQLQKRKKRLSLKKKHQKRKQKNQPPHFLPKKLTQKRQLFQLMEIRKRKNQKTDLFYLIDFSNSLKILKKILTQFSLVISASQFLSLLVENKRVLYHTFSHQVPPSLINS